MPAAVAVIRKQSVSAQTLDCRGIAKFSEWCGVVLSATDRGPDYEGSNDFVESHIE